MRVSTETRAETVGAGLGNLWLADFCLTIDLVLIFVPAPIGKPNCN